jgi:formylglycine-generating enzyme required for sulfatase activity
MAGNVGELMASSWESYPHGAAEPGPDSYIVWRGGTWSSSARAMRCTERDRTRRDGHNYSQGGFRVIIAPRT